MLHAALGSQLPARGVDGLELLGHFSGALLIGVQHQVLHRACEMLKYDHTRCCSATQHNSE